MKEGVPDEYLPNLLDAASKGYLLGYGDKTIGTKPNEREYDINEIKLLIKSVGDARGN